MVNEQNPAQLELSCVPVQDVLVPHAWKRSYQNSRRRNPRLYFCPTTKKNALKLKSTDGKTTKTKSENENKMPKNKLRTKAGKETEGQK